MKDFYTRKQYLNKEVTHEEYYGQFGEKLVPIVLSCFGEKTIKKSDGNHFNSIPLSRWDSLVPYARNIVGHDIMKASNSGGVSISDCVCALKAAARIIYKGE